MVNRKLAAVLCWGTIAFSLPSFYSFPAHAEEISKSNQAEVASVGSTVVSASKLFKISFETDPSTIPLNAFHTWTLTIQDADGAPVTDAEIGIGGGMPAHGHGLPTQPKMTKNLGNGKYLIEGFKFPMPGQWEINFNIKSGGKEDKATVPLDI